MLKKCVLYAFAVCAVFMTVGCSTPFTTNTKRSAVEQYLLATTIERLTEHAGLGKYAKKKIFFDYSYLKTQEDQVYLQGRLEMIMSKYNCIIVPKQEEAEVMIQPLCGVLATDYNTIFIGTPALPIPVPDTTISVVIPEIPIFKLYDRKAYGRISFNIFDAKTRKPLEVIPEICASSTHKNWVILLVPFKTYNFSMSDTKETSSKVDFIP